MLWGYHFVETSPRPCSLHQLLCFGVIILLKLCPVLARYISCYALGLSFCWNFAPSLLVTSAAMQCFGVIILLKLRPVLAYNINCYITPWSYHHEESCWNFAPSLLVTMAATAIHDILLVHGMYCLPQQKFHVISRHVRVVPCPSVATMRNITSVASFRLKFCFLP